MSAILSECGTYRYRLERVVRDLGTTYAFFGVNPSTADATLDDATVRKWTGFVDRWQGWRYLVGNAFAYRATDVRELARAAAPIGADNDFHIERIASQADVLVPCWGNTDKVPPSLRGRFRCVLDILRATGKPIMCFGFTASGDPKHPLMLGYSTPLVEWQSSSSGGREAHGGESTRQDGKEKT
jgi:hypothetical protein